MMLSACATSSSQEDVAAVIVKPTAESRAELAKAVSTALNGAPVTLAEDALTTESSLLIERTPARDATGQRLSGRDLGRPERFELVKSGERCVLVHENTGARFELRAVDCVAK